jgi:hypothetical protein
MSYTRHLDDAFLKFVNTYIKEERFFRPSDIFAEIEKIENKSEDGIFWSEDDVLDYQGGFLSGEEAIKRNKDILFTERLTNCIKEFRRFLLEYPIQISFPQDGSHRICSNQLSCSSHYFKEVLQTKFFSYKGNPLYVMDREFENALKKFFKAEDVIVVVSEDKYKARKEFLKQDKNAYCMFTVFGNFKYEEIFELFPKDESYSDTGEVAEYLKREYEVVQSFVTRNILPTLKALKSKIL